MNTARIVSVIAISGLLSGCSMFNPDMWSSWNGSYSQNANNAWLTEADTYNGYRNTKRPPVIKTASSQHVVADTAPQMPLRKDVLATRSPQ